MKREDIKYALITGVLFAASWSASTFAIIAVVDYLMFFNTGSGLNKTLLQGVPFCAGIVGFPMGIAYFFDMTGRRP